MTVINLTKKPVTIQGVQWTKDTIPQTLIDFTNGLVKINDADGEFSVYDRLHDTWVKFKWNDWILKGTKGEFYPCDPEVIEECYDKEEVADA